MLFILDVNDYSYHMETHFTFLSGYGITNL